MGVCGWVISHTATGAERRRLQGEGEDGVWGGCDVGEGEEASGKVEETGDDMRSSGDDGGRKGGE